MNLASVKGGNLQGLGVQNRHSFVLALRHLQTEQYVPAMVDNTDVIHLPLLSMVAEDVEAKSVLGNELFG